MKSPARTELSAIPEVVAMNMGQSGMTLARILPATTQLQLERMFRDPRLLSKEERGELIENLLYCTKATPGVVELRVLLGMAECIDFRVQSAMESLREAVRRDPENFLAQLKFGELLMRLRICDQAVEHTDRAARLAANPAQSELARRQAATLRTMMREGIERDGVTHPLRIIGRWFAKLTTRQSTCVAIVAAE